MRTIDIQNTGARAIEADPGNASELAHLRTDIQMAHEELTTLHGRVDAHGIELRLLRELIAHEANKRRRVGHALRVFFVRFEHRIDRLHRDVKSLKAEDVTRRQTRDAIATAFQHLVRLLGSRSSSE